MKMNRSPIYQTFSTRILVLRRKRPRWHLPAALLGIAALVIVGLILGQGFATPRPDFGTKGATSSNPSSARSDILQRFEQGTATPAAPAPGAAAPAPGAAAPAPAATAEAVQSAAPYLVAGTEGLGLVLRADPSPQSVPLATLADGTPLTVLGEEVIAEGMGWLPVRDAAGIEGWVAAEYVAQS
ncbi:MAG: hypothetical protein RLZZ387_5273 [Chloroflexota bacterium]|jgi:hypothetical protein